MPDLKFSCPHCQQHIQAEAGYSGMQINCPACGRSMMVPAAPAAPTPALAPAMAAVSAPVYSPPPPVPATGGCPSCGSALPRGAVICTQCGYNLVTRSRSVAGRAALPGRPRQPQGEAPWYKTAYPYVGFVAVVLGLLYFLGRENDSMKLAFVGVAALYCLTVHIMVVVTAFGEGAGTGFLTLCVPFYAVYFVFKVSESPNLQILYGMAVIINISLKFLY